MPNRQVDIGLKRSSLGSIRQENVRVIASVQRAIDILNLFDTSHTELGNAEIARAMGLPKSTVAGLIHTLETNDFLVQNPDNRKYRLGFKLVEYGSLLLDQIDLRQEARPFLKALLEWCNESVNLAIWDGDSVVYIERVFGTNLLGMRPDVGKREPVYSTALGKSMLACMNEAEQRSILGNLPMTAKTPRTIVNVADFLEDLRTTRERGYAIDDEENEVGGRCVAAAIRGPLGRPLGAVSISVPIQRLPEDQFPLFGHKVREVAEAISQRLGFHPIR